MVPHSLCHRPRGIHVATDNAGWGGSIALDRRTVLRGSALAVGGLAAAALIGCGGDDNNDGGTTTPSSATSAATQTVPNKNQNPAQVRKDPNLPYPFGFAEPD